MSPRILIAKQLLQQMRGSSEADEKIEEVDSQMSRRKAAWSEGKKARVVARMQRAYQQTRKDRTVVSAIRYHHTERMVSPLALARASQAIHMVNRAVVLTHHRFLA